MAEYQDGLARLLSPEPVVKLQPWMNLGKLGAQYLAPNAYEYFTREPPTDLVPNAAGKVPSAQPDAAGLGLDVAGLMPMPGAAGAKLAVAGAAAARGAAGLAGAAERTAARAAPEELARVLAPPQGIRAFHSSPHDFERFSMSKIGTGEGAQVYGRGLYFAENPKVSGQGGEYWQNFMDRFPPSEREAARFLINNKFDRAAASAEAAEVAQYYRQKALDDPLHLQGNWNTRAGMIERARDVLMSEKQIIGPRTYEVNIRAQPEQFLDWDKPFGQQSAALQEALRSPLQAQLDRQAAARRTILERGTDAAGRPLHPADIMRFSEPVSSIENVAGSDVYKRLGLPAVNREAGSLASTQRLREAGIPGIRYLDAGSRTSVDQLRIDLADQQSRLAEAVAARDAGRPTIYNTNVDDVINLHQGMVNDLTKQIASPPTSNYVVTDDAIIDILRKYGLAGTAGAVGAAGVARDQGGM